MTASFGPQSFAPELCARLEHGIRLGLDLLAERPDLSEDDLAGALYGGWYAAPVGEPQVVDPTWPPLAGMLREAHAGARLVSDATVIRRGAAGIAVVRRDDGPLHAATRGEYLHPDGSTNFGLVPAVGERLSVLTRFGAAVADGWWRTWGGGWDPRTVGPGLSRLYLAPQLALLPDLVATLSDALGAVSTPWMFKAGIDDYSINRADAVVVYLADAEVDLRSALARRAEAFVRWVPGPPFTEWIAPGISWSEDPQNGLSFGEERCRLVAEALIAARDHPLVAVENAFVRAGLDPSEPHRRAVRREGVGS
ncbi:T3SS effector HopA1 family protein [Lacisediminihabitans sp.]|uniref:T3SS effector HopA1 family protein n=1 Tax=Lacisediminihabitans sp. TaxID=2787631 RepID=UPI002F943A13